jgi:NAD-dependent deacetylase
MIHQAANICEEDIRRASYAISRSSCVVALTGSGISAESGLPTFRGSDAVWEGCRPEDLASPEAFKADPKRVWEWYNKRREQVSKVKPNAGHYAMCKFRDMCKHFVVITQNCDGLHTRAGSPNVVELHGNIWRVLCTECDYSEYAENRMLGEQPKCPKCGAWLRPGVVWFREALPAESFQMGMEACECCNVLLVVGTSAAVQPAASLIWQAKACGANVVEINPEPTAASCLADIRLTGPAGRILPMIVEGVLAIRQTVETAGKRTLH